jgi:hypothetical protein
MAVRSRLYSSAAWHDWSKAQVFKNGAWHEVQRIRAWKTVGGQQAWRDVYVKGGTTPTPSPSPTPTPTPTPAVTLSVVPSPTSVSGTIVGTGVCYTNVVTVSASKGTPPYTYVFSRSTYSGNIIPNILVGAQPNTAQFSRNMTVVPDYQSAIFKCRVTDSKGNTGECSITAEFLTTTIPHTAGDGTASGLEPGHGGIQPSY